MTLFEPNPTGPGVAAPLDDRWTPRSTHTSELEKFLGRLKFIGHVLQWRFKFPGLLAATDRRLKWAPKEGLRQFEATSADLMMVIRVLRIPEIDRDRGLGEKPWTYLQSHDWRGRVGSDGLT